MQTETPARIQVDAPGQPGWAAPMGLSESISTDSIMAIVGVRADVVTAGNKEELARRLPHPFVAQMNDGDVLWPVRDLVKGRIHLCAVKISKASDEPSVGLMSRERGEEHEGTVSIVGGSIVLQSGARRYDMLTCRLFKAN